ncbi:hypothetical protein BVH03_05455 [Pseudomonas sp. PA15(2017)]|nr:hypothetical protein BVH03_05455 [Pseudomonas sp. PA15(2017)]
MAFAQQSGLQVSAEQQLVGHLRSKAIKGQMSSEQALSRLLDGSNVGWQYSQQVVIFHQLASQNDAIELSNTIVLGRPENTFQGEAVIDRQAIENFAGANGDLTSMLKMHPSVRFDTSQQSSNTPGELNPADISINGAKFYQNNFMIDGISINNDLDPAASSGSRNNVHNQYGLPSNAFGIAIDADLLEEVRVYDSNVPAEYGKFNGGVVDAITRRPSEDFHGKVSASMTRSEWTKYHINGEVISDEEFKYSSTYANQPEFKKLTTRVMLEGHLTENFGLIGNFVRKTSEIPLYTFEGGFASASEPVKRNQTREIENAMIKGFWTPDDRLDLSFTLINAPAENEYFRQNTRNSGFRVDQGGRTAQLKTVWRGDQATYTNKLSYRMVQSSRDADSAFYVPWRWSDEKNWGNPFRNGVRDARAVSADGGMGDLEQQQTGFEYGFKADLHKIDLFGTEHKLTFGADISRQKASYEVLEDTYAAGLLATRAANASSSCVTASGRQDITLCSIANNAAGERTRQFFRQINYVQAGKIEATQTDYSLYAQDDIQIGQLNLRPGLRFDADNYMDKKTVAPRFAASYDLFGDSSSVLSGGANRYYGRNLFKYRLADGRESLRWRMNRAVATGNTISDFGEAINWGVDESAFRKIDMPYDDELMLGFSQLLAGARFDLKYVHRDGKDQVVRSRASRLGLIPGNGADTIADYYTYTNAGKSNNQTITLTITPQEFLRVAGTLTNAQLGFDWSRTKSPQSTYEAVLTVDQLADNDVYYDGKLIPYSELPADNFNRPWTARLNTVTNIPVLNLTWSNFFRYRGAYEQIYSTNNITIDGDVYAAYTNKRVAGAPTWDTRVKWEIPTYREQSAYVALDITNVADKVNSIVSDTNGTVSYEVGRQYWLEVGYQF